VLGCDENSANRKKINFKNKTQINLEKEVFEVRYKWNIRLK
jgi:hypothetical protein